MKRIKSYGAILLFTIIHFNSFAQDNKALISEFESSELCGTYEADFDQLNFFTENYELIQVEGQVSGKLYIKPEGKSNLEIYRSYERELKNAGFEMLFSCSIQKCKDLKKKVKTEYYGKQTFFGSRQYEKVGKTWPDKDYPSGFNEFYISARKAMPDATYYVLFMVGDYKPQYSIDIIKTSPMETGTVSLRPELLKSKIEAEGKIAIYELQFDVDSDVLQSGYQPVLKLIADYLEKDGDSRFYIAGHTDDEGEPDYNLTLSEKRAQSVLRALVDEFAIDQNRVMAVGVGPFAPLGSNQTTSGKTMNRRVELVIRNQ